MKKKTALIPLAAAAIVFSQAALPSTGWYQSLVNDFHSECGEPYFTEDCASAFWTQQANGLTHYKNVISTMIVQHCPNHSDCSSWQAQLVLTVETLGAVLTEWGDYVSAPGG